MERSTTEKQGKYHPSKLRKLYFVKLCGRIAIFIGAVALYLYRPEQLDILHGGFFQSFSLLHILWGIWMIDMLDQLFPMRKQIALGSHKHFIQRFRPIKEKINTAALRDYIVSTTKAAYKVFLIWAFLTIALGLLYFFEVLSAAHLFLISVLFYVCDLICVLVWCPFRLLMKNRCCTTCRIFNWDHLMMFLPMLFVNSFFSISLLVAAFVVWILWELCVMLYPERFWEQSNQSLKCSECTDKLCTQYCRKLRER